ncbi:hypothetical protein BpHYR1_039908 [Brachionus plicatilis]|uniref:Uncharacterized protein n=1 Tax=Brachionus plicatilis TaxID=10195 RepID=A0A3M7PGX7_BRAPC|nr:hypothetical protein BpHYR1_039908 [Brachionus plicatilis]
MVYDVIIWNIPDIVRSRYLFLRRLRDRSEEEGLTDLIFCVVMLGQSGRAGPWFASFEDLIDNDRMVQWSGMVFHGNRLEFKANRRARQAWFNVEARWNRPQREPEQKPDQERNQKQILERW